MKNTSAGIVMRRWTEQRWLLDNISRSIGLDWDQPRTITCNTPGGWYLPPPERVLWSRPPAESPGA
jgi:hypothetical protein